MFYNYNITVTRELECDTLVIGGGLAGSSAATASARGGASTVLAEAGGTLGGQAGIGLVTPLASEKSKSGISFGGLADEIVGKASDLTEKYVCENNDNCNTPTLKTYAYACARARTNESAHEGDNSTDVYTISPHISKYVLLKMAYDAGVNLHFHTVLCDVKTRDGKIDFAILKDKSGFLKVKAKNYIDASGDADMIYLAGDEYVTGSESGIFGDLCENALDKIHGDGEKYEKYEKDNLMQPVSLFFVMRGVDYKKASALNNKSIFFGDFGITEERFKKWQFAGTPGFEITSNRVPMPQNRVLVSHGRHKDEAVINMSRIIGINGSEADDLSKGEIMAQLQLIAVVDFLKTFIPGFENSYLSETSSRLGVRESRRLCGKYKLSGSEVINCKKFDDAVCRGNYLIDIHDPQGKRNAIGGEINGDYYEIPFGALCSKNFSNLLACGRCISCDHIAHSATRIQGSCILTGQAAGTACALSRILDVPPCSLDVNVLRNRLKKDNVNI